MRTYVLLAMLLFPVTGLAIVPTGAEAPAFKSQTYDGKELSLAELQGKTVVLEWFNPGCPFVKKHYESGHMQSLQKKYSEKNVVWVTVNSTNSDHKDFLNAEQASKIKGSWGIENARMVQDVKGELGKLYFAKTTPHMFVINPEGKLVYQGAIDDNSSTFSKPAEARNFVQEALDAIESGKAIEVSEKKPYGCSVKY